MEELNLIKQALDKANKSGVFTLEESSLVLTSIIKIQNKLKEYETAKEAVKIPENKE